MGKAVAVAVAVAVAQAEREAEAARGRVQTMVTRQWLELSRHRWTMHRVVAAAAVPVAYDPPATRRGGER